MMIKSINGGIAMGNCLVIDQESQQKPPKKDLVHELNRYFRAKQEILSEIEQAKPSLTHEKEMIDVQKALINDPVIEKEIIARIKKQDICALDSVDEIYENYVSLLRQSNDPYLSERTLDFLDIKMRLINKMYDDLEDSVIDCNTIILSKSIYPSMVLNLNAFVKGIISYEGSSLTHSAILIKEKNIPYVVTEPLAVKTGDYIILDATKGEVIINPSESLIKDYLNQVFERTVNDTVSFKRNEFHLGLNISTKIDELTLSSPLNDGISLFRSEFLYLRHQSFPSRSEQYEVYEHLLKHSYPKEVVIRTYDIGDDKQLSTDQISNKGLNLYFNRYKEVFELQLDVLIDLYQNYDNLRVLLPMVKEKNELSKVHLMVNELSNGRKIPPIGIMLETKEAYQQLNQFKHVDFISIGSNDLGEALFNIKRDQITDFNSYVDLMSKPIKDIIEFSNKNEIPCTVCGGIAANKYGIMRLLELGATKFGVPSSFIVEANLAIERHQSSLKTTK